MLNKQNDQLHFTPPRDLGTMSANGTIAAPTSGTSVSSSGGQPGTVNASAGNGAMVKGNAVPSQNGFGANLLKKLGLPVTAANLKFLDAWQKAEGGSPDNPFNTTEPGAGATTFNSAGVKRYPSMQEGLDATAKTLALPAYQSIRDALARGNDAHACAVALAGTPWGTGSLVEQMV